MDETQRFRILNEMFNQVKKVIPRENDEDIILSWTLSVKTVNGTYSIKLRSPEVEELETAQEQERQKEKPKKEKK